jgi:hypothetical protein
VLFSSKIATKGFQMKRYFVLGLALLFGFLALPSFAMTSYDGTWTALFPRSCLNGNEMAEEVTTHIELSIVDAELTYRLNYKGQPIEAEYVLKSLGAENDSIWEATQVNTGNGSTQFQLIKNGDTLTTLIDDPEGKFCGGGFIVTNFTR